MIRIFIFVLFSVSAFGWDYTSNTLPPTFQRDGVCTTTCPSDKYFVKYNESYEGTIDYYSTTIPDLEYQQCASTVPSIKVFDKTDSTYTWDEAQQKYHVVGTSYYRYYTCTGTCTAPAVYDEVTGTCQEPITCPPHSTYDPSTESCKCTLPYVPSYDLNGTLTCILTDCPPIYENHNPPLPLFLQTDSPSKCNFFPMADAAVLDLDGKICCYGQEWDQDSPTCGTNEIELNGECYPIDSQDSNSSDPTDCQPGTHWDNYTQQCVLDDDPWRDANGTSGIDADNPDNNGTTPGALPTQGDMDAFNEAMNIDGVSDELGRLINSYVLVQLPVNVGGQCSNEMVKTFTILGRSYTLDLREYMSMMDQYLPIIKMLVMFLFAVTGVVIVLSGRSD